MTLVLKEHHKQSALVSIKSLKGPHKITTAKINSLDS